MLRFSGRQLPPPKLFPASAAQQGKPIYERFLSDLCPKKRKSFYFSALEKGRSMSNKPDITYVLSISWLPLAEPWRITTTIAAGGLSGGVTASMAGGDFWDGLCNGLITAGLNHAMHLVAENTIPENPPKGANLRFAA